MAAKALSAKTFAPVLPHSYPATDAIGDGLKAIGRFFAVGFEIFNEAQTLARKAHAKYPFAD